ncbi:glutathione S-transferase family protein [Sphingomonas adhaesiva]|uniref:glutathione S-transferase family protein n=1 Tax=Sphingomonas adhaesiva TaxID=28212 RepID=UPI002FF6FFDE
MKLYSAPMPAPNPRRVRMFAAEKGIALDEVMLDLRQRDHKAPEHVVRNSLGQVPVLELDDGTTLSETIAICRYLDGIHPEPPMFGRTPLEMAQVDMWIRRFEIQIGEPVKMYWRHAHPATAALIEQHRDFGRSNLAALDRAMAWLEGEVADGRTWLTGETLTVVDIAAVTIVDFAELIGMQPIKEAKAVAAWHARMTARPSYAA